MRALLLTLLFVLGCGGPPGIDDDPSGFFEPTGADGDDDDSYGDPAGTGGDDDSAGDDDDSAGDDDDSAT